MMHQRLTLLLSICLATTARSVASRTFVRQASSIADGATAVNTHNSAAPTIVAVTAAYNDLVNVLQACGMDVLVRPSAAAGLEAARKGDLLMLLADQYPMGRTSVPATLVATAAARGVNVFAEFPEVGTAWGLPGGGNVTAGNLTFQRLVVTTDALGPSLPPMKILYAHGAVFVDYHNVTEAPILVSDRVVGYDTAVYGVNNGTVASPILFRHPTQPHVMIAATKLSSFVTGRFGPTAAWAELWPKLLNLAAPALPSPPKPLTWIPTVRPSFSRDERLPDGALAMAARSAIEWLRLRSALLPGPSAIAAICDELDPAHVDTRSPLSNCSYGECKHRAPSATDPFGDGRMGVLEGYTNLIQTDGAQYQVLEFRADCNCETAMTFASYGPEAGPVTDSEDVAANLLDFVFARSGLQQPIGISGANDSAPMGLLHWTMGGSQPGLGEHDGQAVWGDDNARAILGAWTAVGRLGNTGGRWNGGLAAAILGNFRQHGVDGFRPISTIIRTIKQKGWESYYNANYTDCCAAHDASCCQSSSWNWREWAFSPHMESWPWAVYLRAFALTGYEPFYERSHAAIATMMAEYPAWYPIANGIQLQKARMVLPLAWLVRARDTPEHRAWLHRVVDDLLAKQQPCGAIQEEICAPGWMCTDTTNTPLSNAAYGTSEAPLQQTNSDPVTDALYTVNFAAVGLHEAAAATGNATIADASRRLLEYLARIQQRSDTHPELNGAWMRAFDYEKWEVWASAADIGWGPWCIETGWMNSWIVSTLTMHTRNETMWDITGAEGNSSSSLAGEIRALLPFFLPKP